jgi:anti-anti-sigma factor
MSGEILSIELEQDGEAVVIKPSGELDISTASVLDAALREAMDRGRSEVIVDLGGLSFIDSTGLRLLVVTAERARAAGNRLRLLRGSEPVERMLEVSGLDRSLPFVD